MMRMDVHIHSDFSDGSNSICEIVSRAVELGMDAIAVVDHVRADTAWLHEFCDEIERVKVLFGEQISVLCGIEAKCLDLNGNLDMPPGAEKDVDFVMGAIHRIPGKSGFVVISDDAAHKKDVLEFWYESVLSMLGNPHMKVWAHPARVLHRARIDIPVEMSEAIALVAREKRKYVEMNMTYGLPRGSLLAHLERCEASLIPGSDAHSVDDMNLHSSKCICSNELGIRFMNEIQRE